MKVVFDHQIFSRQEYGGISKYFTEIAREYLNLPEIDLEIISPFYINNHIATLPKPIITGFKINRIPLIFGPTVIIYLNNLLSKFIFNRNNHTDIIHETYFSPNTILSPNTVRVLTVYDMIHEKFPNIYLKNKSHAISKRRAINSADHIVCISNNTKKDLIDLLSIDEKKISVIHMGCSSINTYKLKSDVLNDRPTILFVGKRNEYKNFNRFINCIANNENIKNKYVIVCYGGGSFSTIEKSMFNKLGFSTDSIKQVSGDDNKLKNYYGNADLFVFPSLYEGFGLPLLEAMTHGCPVACSNTSSFPEVVNDAAEMFDPLNEDEISNAMKNVLFHPERSRELIQKGYERTKFFSWKKCALETVNLYKKLV